MKPNELVTAIACIAIVAMGTYLSVSGSETTNVIGLTLVVVGVSIAMIICWKEIFRIPSQTLKQGSSGQ